MTPTIYALLRALLAPEDSMHALKALRPVADASGRPLIRRTARFAEAEIVWREERWLLAMPLAPVAISAVERIAAHLGTLRSEWLADYRLLREEMRYEDAAGTHRRCDMVLQHLPAGRTFDEALDTEPCDTLLAALDALEEELRRLDLSHRNLKAENLRWHRGRLIPIRYHYARTGFGADAEALGALRDLVRRRAGEGAQPRVHDTEAAYSSGERFAGHIWTGNAFEQLVCVEDEAGYGYVDLQNRPVIPAQYLWADDFREGRAAVTLHDGRMGLIDKTGRYVIEPRYEIVEYDPDTNRTLVRHEGLWAEFDYEGNRTSDFAPRSRIPETENEGINLT